MRIIGISGRREDGTVKGAGKDEVAKILVRDHGWVVVSLADEIKRTAVRWYGLDPEWCWGPSELRETIVPWMGISVRVILQQIGTQVGRSVYGDTWVDYTLKIIRQLASGQLAAEGSYQAMYDRYDVRFGICSAERGMVYGTLEGVVVPDVRWPAGNEGRAIKSAPGGQLWVVERAGTSHTGGPLHDSEKQSTPPGTFDVTLQNNGTLQDLEMAVHRALLRTADQAGDCCPSTVQQEN